MSAGDETGLTPASEKLLRDFDRTPEAIDHSELSARLWLIEREAAASPSGEVDVHAAYREGRRAVWRELIELAEQGIQASSEYALDGRREEG